jgi:ferredoxin--NADP+ reductase
LKYVQENPDKNVDKNIACINEYANRSPSGKRRLLTIRFLVSPTEVIGDEGKVAALKLVKNEAYLADDGSIRARKTDSTEELQVGLVFRSVGYRGVALPEVSFNEDLGIIENRNGRVYSSEGEQVTGLYTAGWIKRGPSGVIGTNKTCARETVNCMTEDLQGALHFNPDQTDPFAMEALVRERQPDVVTYEDWEKINEAELAKGEAANRPRVKFTNVDDMLAVLNR